MNKFLLFNLFIFFFDCSIAQVSEQWVARYTNNNSGGNDSPRDLEVDKYGNTYVTGWSTGTNSDFDIVTIKYDQNGSEVWVKRYDGPSHLDDYGYSIYIDSLNNVYVAGKSAETSQPSKMVTLKYDSIGNLLWAKRYSASVYNATYQKRIVVDKLLNVYVSAGDYSGNAIVIKYNSTGIQQWIGEYNYYQDSWATCLLLDNFNNVYCTGFSNNSNNNNDLFLAKFDTTGTLKWSQRYDSGAISGDNHDEGNALAFDELSSSIYVTGRSTNSNNTPDFITIKYDTAGSQQWIKRFNGLGDYNDIPWDIKLDNQKNVYVTGYSDGAFGDNDYTLVKYSPSGTQLWVGIYDYGGQDNSASIEIDSSCNIYVFGSSNGPVSTSIDFALVKFDSTGHQLWSIRYNGTGSNYDGGQVVKLDNNNNIYVTGYSHGLDLSPDYVTIKYSQITGVVSPEFQEEFFQLYPNPATNSITLDLTSSSLTKNSQLQIINSLAQTVYQSTVNTQRFSVDVSSLNPGVYFLSINDGEREMRGKFIKE
jgi:hypothetical protein